MREQNYYMYQYFFTLRLILYTIWLNCKEKDNESVIQT